MTMTAAMLLAASGQANAGTPTEKTFIGKQEITIKDGRMTPEALWAMGRIGGTSVSLDGKQIAYTVSYYSVKDNASHTVIYVMNADGSNNRLLTTSAASESEPAWIKGGTKSLDKRRHENRFPHRTKRKQPAVGNESRRNRTQATLGIPRRHRRF